jgi:hypothetical protein
VGEEKMEPSPWGPGASTHGKYVSRVDIDGFNVVQDYVQEKEGKVSFRGHGVFAHDTRAHDVTWYWVDTTGHVPATPARGTWQGDTLTLSSMSPEGGGRFTFRLEGDHSFEFVLENSFDGGQTWTKFMSGRYRKV